MNNRERVLRYLAAFSSGDPEEVVAHVTDDFDNRQVSELGEGCHGKHVYRERLSDFLADFSQLTYVPHATVVDGDQVGVTYEMSCLYNGKPVAIQGAMVMTLRDGRIAARADYWDSLSFLKQTR